jgi:O-antigen biosynthesis protein
VLDELVEIAPDVQLVPYPKPFNFSEKCNLGAESSYGDVVVLLNDDVEIESPGFLPNLVAPLLEEGVGMTGAKLLFADSSIQHAGLTLDRHDLTHVFAAAPPEDPGPFAALLVNREVSGLTGACVALMRDTFEDIGGLSEHLPVNFNDVDLSFKVRAQGLRLVWVANAVAFHFESQTRIPVVHPWESLALFRRWTVPDEDPYLPSESKRTAERKREARLARKG